MSRSQARLVAVQYVYAKAFGYNDDPREFVEYTGKLKKDRDKEFAVDLITVTVSNMPNIDAEIKKHLTTKITLMDRSVLRVGFGELLYLKDAHPVVVVSEYVEIADKLSDEKGKFVVNAVMDKAIKDTEPTTTNTTTTTNTNTK